MIDTESGSLDLVLTWTQTLEKVSLDLDAVKLSMTKGMSILLATLEILFCSDNIEGSLEAWSRVEFQKSLF